MSVELQNKFGRVGVLYGGMSAEREVSLESGQAVYKALQGLGLDVVAIDVQEKAVENIMAAAMDRAFIALHGKGGEDGTIQGLLEFLNIPYTGSGVQASALAMDKLKCKHIWRSLALPTPIFVELNENSDWQVTMEALNGAAMVKPAHEGSSIGMSLVHSAEELKNAYELASKFDSKVFAEQLIVGAEYTVAILSGQSLPAIKLETDNVFYDYDAKYISEDTRYLIPCGLSDEKQSELSQLSVKAFESIDGKGWGRVDFMADDKGNFYLLEVNTVPGMTSHSLVPMAARASGKDFGQLCLAILEETLR